MHRRAFPRHLAAALALPLVATPAPAPRRPYYPARLRRGDLVRIITPGSYLDDEGMEKAVRQIEGLGMRVALGEHARAEHGFLAGTDAQRLGDLHAAFAAPEVRAVWCGRGGYGCGRLLPDLDYKLIRRHPKILIGYSDITALLSAITGETGLVTYHGPVGSSDFTDYTRRHLGAALLAGEPLLPLLRPPEAVPAYTIRPGRATGRLWGGNLTLLSSLVGTGYAPPVAGNLLFIEEIREQPYRIDRMLTQLRQAWPLKRAAGILLGEFRGCEAEEGDRSLSLRETLTGRLADLGVPVAYGFPFGHIRDMVTLPVGGLATVDTASMTVELAGA